MLVLDFTRYDHRLRFTHYFPKINTQMEFYIRGKTTEKIILCTHGVDFEDQPNRSAVIESNVTKTFYMNIF